MMRSINILAAYISALLFRAGVATSFPAETQHRFRESPAAASVSGTHNVSIKLFAELEEFARLVDIAYCVGVTGIQAPFECASRCDEFPGYELVDTWNTGPLMSDSCGYIALDHRGKRVIVAFRGTYSITNTIIDLTTVPQEYVPYPGDPEESPDWHDLLSRPRRWLRKANDRLFSRSSTETVYTAGSGQGDDDSRSGGLKCHNCTVHMGFFSSWKDCRRLVIPHLTKLREEYPHYKLYLVGHSLGGAVAALAGLETEILGWHPTVTTFGEPRVGNEGLRDYIDEIFELRVKSDSENEESNGWTYGGNRWRYRRMTHVNDPVPLLPLTEWGFRMHAGEIYISKAQLQPSISDLRLCDDDEDPECIFSGEGEALFSLVRSVELDGDGTKPDVMRDRSPGDFEASMRWGLPARYHIWQLFFAHRDYFWRIGLCAPGGDLWGGGRAYDAPPDSETPYEL